MSLKDALLPEFDHEMASTRKMLERVPEDKMTWKPHPKSGALGWLATHVANLPHWAVMTIEKDSLDLAPEGEQMKPAPPAESRQALLEAFDGNVKAARAAIEGASDERLLAPWSLLVTGKTVFTMPRMAVLRGMVMNHMIHHRAQLGVYLRLNDIPVPALYGPSADEDAM